MPHIVVHAWPGHTKEEKEALAEKIVTAVSSEYGSRPGSVSVSFNDVPSDKWPEFCRDEVFTDKMELLKEPDYKTPRFITNELGVVYKTAEDEVLAVMNFAHLDENTVEIHHTEVDGSLRGQGIAGKLAERAAYWLRVNGKKVIPSCSFAASWFAGSTEYKDLVK